MRCIRIFPDRWAKTVWPFSSSARNVAAGKASVIVAVTRIKPLSDPLVGAALGVGLFWTSLMDLTLKNKQRDNSPGRNLG